MLRNSLCEVVEEASGFGKIRFQLNVRALNITESWNLYIQSL